jgi:hypothetical protein
LSSDNAINPDVRADDNHYIAAKHQDRVMFFMRPGIYIRLKPHTAKSVNNELAISKSHAQTAHGYRATTDTWQHMPSSHGLWRVSQLLLALVELCQPTNHK